ncbi:hypothetical protein PMZ80_009479, partial [Knufia obscura]
KWEGFTLMTDPNFLHAGDHVHLGPGVTGTRQTNPAVNLEDLPQVDAILLSHYHADHFDEKVETSLRRDLPIITTPHAKDHLANKASESFTNVHALDFWQDLTVDFLTSQTTSATLPKPQIHVTGMPGTHVPPGPLAAANDLLGAVPPTNGWMLELGYSSPQGQSSQPSNTSATNTSDSSSTFQSGYRIYISGDTLLFDDLHKIPEMYSSHTGKPIDLMLIHLGGTTIPSPKVPLLMVTMDSKMGVQLMQVINADVTVPIHYDDYDVFLSPLSDFKKAVEDAGLNSKVVYLDRGEEYRFEVRKDESLMPIE